MIYEGEKWSFKEQMTCGAPQGSRVGPLVWNVIYDDFLRMERASSASRIMHLSSSGSDISIGNLVESSAIRFELIWKKYSNYQNRGKSQIIL